MNHLSSFLTQSRDEGDSMEYRDHSEANEDKLEMDEDSIGEHPSPDPEEVLHRTSVSAIDDEIAMPNIGSPPMSPAASMSLNVKPSSPPVLNTKRLVKQLITQHEEKVNMIFNMNKTEMTESLQQSLEQLQKHFEERFATKEQEYRQLDVMARHRVDGKDQEIAALKQQLESQQEKYQQLQEKLANQHYHTTVFYQSPYSVRHLFNVWKQQMKKQKHLALQEKLINRLQNQFIQEKYFLLLMIQHQTEKQRLVNKDLRFKYDTLSSEMVMKYENEVSQIRTELREAYATIQAEEKKRLLLEEELKKVLVKNMNSMNVEALTLFQQINQASHYEIPSKLVGAVTSSTTSNPLEESLMSTDSDLSNVKPVNVMYPSTNHHPSHAEQPPTTINATNSIQTTTSQRPVSSNQLFNMNSSTAGTKTKPTSDVFSASDAHIARLSAMYQQSVSASQHLAKLPPTAATTTTTTSNETRTHNNNHHTNHTTTSNGLYRMPLTTTPPPPPPSFASRSHHHTSNSSHHYNHTPSRYSQPSPATKGISSRASFYYSPASVPLSTKPTSTTTTTATTTKEKESTTGTKTVKPAFGLGGSRFKY